MSLHDEHLYQRVADELRASGPVEGLWLKALTETLGDEHKAKFVYTKLRVAQFKSEIAAERRKNISSSDAFKNAVIIIVTVIAVTVIMLISYLSWR